MRFSDFLNERKKVVEPEWHEVDYSSGYSKLRDLQNYCTDKADHFRVQLFVPKHRDPKLMADRKRDADWRQIKREIPDAVTEASIPVLTSFKEQPPGDNKPAHAFWTSSAKKKSDGTYTSDWYEFVKNVFPEWQTDYGFLFEIDHSALVYQSDQLEQFYNWTYMSGKMTMPEPEWAKSYDKETRMRSHFPWDIMARHFDGVHHPYRSSRDDFTYGWDVESTAWFNTKVLKYAGAVKLWHGWDDDE